MAQPTLALEYWDGDSWVKAVTHTGNNAIISCDIGKIADEPDVAHVTLSNPPKNARDTDTTKSKGALTDVFTQDGVNNMQLCVLRDEETGIILFRGRVYKIRNRYEVGDFGSIINVELRDELQELAEIPLVKEHPSLSKMDVSRSGQTPDTTKRSGIIQKIIDTVSKTYTSASFSDTTRFEGSLHSFSESDVVNSSDKSEFNSRYWDFTASVATALEMAQELAINEPQDAADLTNHYGFDFYVDPNFSTFDTSDSDIKPAPSFNYFKRGTRPGAGGSTAAVPQTYGITLEYPSSNWPTISAYAKKGFIRRILQDADFNTEEDSIATSAVVEWEIDDSTDVSSSNGTTTGKQKFELMKATIPSGKFTDGSSEGKSLWEGRRPYYKYSSAAGNETTDDLVVTAIPEGLDDGEPDLRFTFGGTNDQSQDALNPIFLYLSGQTYPCALVNYVSGSASGTNEDSVLLSNVFDSDAVVPAMSKDQYDLHQFLAFPSGAHSRINMGSGINDSATALTVDDASVFAVNDVIRVQDELMNISGVNTTTNVLTVGRGYSSTTAAAHIDNVYVYKSIRLHTRKSKATNATDVPYIDITPSIGRASEKYGLNKPVLLTFHNVFSSFELVKKQVTGELNRRSLATQVKAKVRTTRYPYTRLIAGPDNVTRGTSGSNNVLTFATAPTATDNINMAGHFGASATSLIVDSASGFSIGDIIACTTPNDAGVSVTEQMKITDISSNTFTVTRAVNGTTAVQHADNLAVTGAATFTTADGTTMTNDIRKFGVKKGMIVAQLKGDGVTVKRYAYITAVTATTITYGKRITVGGSADEAKDTNDFLELTGFVDEVASPGVSNSADVTTVTVDTGTRFEATDVIKINTEQMLVVSVSGNDLTVIRGYNDTTRGIHSVDADIHLYNNIAVFVPVETGHSVRIKHKHWGIDFR